jgi:gamma-butyrobetaine dioxygenase
MPLTLRAFHPVRAFPDMDDVDVPEAYAALREFSRLAGSDKFQMRYPFRPGDLVAFDNRRLLHGRASIDVDGGQRELHGTYIDHDEVYSRLRVLSRKLT